ncbi:MAG: cytochrome c family protein [Anaerolineae bacterium]|nr:cytochrome c family protein [Anaerolineae bacterium]
MAQIFHPSTNTIAKVSIFGGVFILAGAAVLIMAFVRSSYMTGVGVFVEQPVPFSHEHHVSGLGIDCRYCHTSVEKSKFAGIPPTETCMTCHSQIWTNAEVLEPVRASFQTEQPIEWVRVHNLPDFVYFNHSIHVAKGVGCETCHGRVDQMAFTYKANTLYMEWCLDCHRHPENYIRPVEEIYTMGYQPPEDQVALGRELVEAYNIQVQQLTNCSVCHY